MVSWQVTTSTATLLRMQDELFRYYRRRVDQTADAEDLVGQTWLAAGRLFEGRASLRYYLFAIARRMTSDYYRGARRLVLTGDELDELPDEFPMLDAWLSAHREHRAVREALETVPETYREALRLWLEGGNNFDIASELGLEYHTARSRLARGKASLIAALRDPGEDP